MSDLLADALAETAHDVADIRDPDVLFTAIARRTRDVISTDMAYVSINSPEHALTEIRATVGVRTEAYARIAMPLGTGVLGTAAGGTAVHTANYLSDTGRTHLPHIDEAVAAEGVRAIAGVPLTSAGRVLGALMVADRSPRAFSESDLSALWALARITTLAVELSTARQRLAGVEAKQAPLRAEIEHLRGRAAFYDAVQALMTVHEVTDLIRIAHGVDAVVLNPADVSLDDPAEGASAAAALQALLSAETAPSARGGRTDDAVVVDENGLVSAQRITGLDGEAAVVAVHPSAPAPIVSDIAQALTAARIYEQALASTQSRTQHELVEDLLGRTPPDSGLHRRARAAHLLPSDHYVVVVVDAPPQHVRSLAARIRSRVAGRGVAAVIDDTVCVIVRQPADADAVQCARDAVTGVQDLVGRAGCAGPVRGFSALRPAHQEARAVADALAALDREHVVADAGLLGVAGLLLSATAPAAARALAARHIAPLVALGPSRAAELMHTARLFLEQNSVSSVAQALGLHVNTVRQRLDRVDSLLGSDWRGSRRLDVHTALVAHRLRTADMPSLRRPNS